MFLNRKLIIAIATFCLTSSIYADTSLPQTSSHQNQTVSQPAATAKVNLNTAAADDLIKIEGISKKRAKNIISYRQKHSNFKALSDLKKVNGFKKMKEANLKAIQDQLTIG